jgi:xylulose-5-phosphate/fructose-6-phosphate phosphoketolase
MQQPPDANTLLSTMDHCLRTRNHINVVVAGKQPQPRWLDWDAAAVHCARGYGEDLPEVREWRWTS